MFNDGNLNLEESWFEKAAESMLVGYFVAIAIIAMVHIAKALGTFTRSFTFGIEQYRLPSSEVGIINSSIMKVKEPMSGEVTKKMVESGLLHDTRNKSASAKSSQSVESSETVNASLSEGDLQSAVVSSSMESPIVLQCSRGAKCCGRGCNR